MKKHKHYIPMALFIIAISFTGIGQTTNYNLSLMDDVDLQNFLSDIDVSSEDLAKYYDGSVYLYKKPVSATLYFLNSPTQKVTANVNLNLQKSSFDVLVKEKTFSFSAKDLSKVDVGQASFLAKNNGVFYKLIFENNHVKVVEEYQLEVQPQSHIIGYESKKNDRIKIEKSIFLETVGGRTSFSRTKKGISKLFGSHEKIVKNFISSKKLSPKSDSDLFDVFSKFQSIFN
jgi:hypothetical protein